MSINKTKILSIVLILTLILTSSFFYMAAIEDNQEKQMSVHDVAEIVYSEISAEVFGGMYIDDTGNLVVNVTEKNAIPKDSRNSMTRTMASTKIIYKIVDKSLQELTEAYHALIPYMKEYGIAILDADDVTNLVDITLSYDHPKTIEELEALVESFIDLKYVNITVLPENSNIELTIASIDEDTLEKIEQTKEVYAEAYGVEPSALSNTIYPGQAITVGNAREVTVGPKSTSNGFSTCGHVALQVFIRTVQLNGNNIGSITQYVFGSDGDRAYVELSNTINYNLPTTNRFLAGSCVYTKTYSYTSSLIGTNIEMHGAVSGISTGIITDNETTCLCVINGTTYTIGNQVQASYICQKGDSGAGIFSLNAIQSTSAVCYGIQSSGLFLENSETSYCSFFSQFDPLLTY